MTLTTTSGDEASQDDDDHSSALVQIELAMRHVPSKRKLGPSPALVQIELAMDDFRRVTAW